MSFLMIFKVALRALWRNKVRSLLTALGIIVGIAAVIAVIAIGQGASSEIKASFASMGNNLIMVFPGSMTQGAMRLGAGNRMTLTAEDGEQIKRDLSDIVAGVTPMVRSRVQAIYQECNWSTQVSGCGVDFPIVRGWDTDQGAFFSEENVQFGHRVLVLGKTVAYELFGDENPVGQSVRVNNMQFQVCGVMERKGTNSMGQDQDDIIIMPYTTVKRTLWRSTFNNVNQLLISLYSMEDADDAKAEITSLLRQRHKLGPGRENDFDVRDMTEIVDSISSISKLMTVLLGVVASISLIVGGIGIMNIMLVSVTERTREIGLRMAIGARPIDILSQFLLESMVLSCMGGLIGVILGCGGAEMVGKFQGWPILITPSSIYISFFFSAFVGVFFGFYPALRASNLNPIECLRYE